tara:strand:+ start:291 stop:641 length:351 start_codon:yes stop_codon:yes gene_type:complete
MKRHNRNKIRKADYGPGQKPAIHNSKKPFNPDRYGKLWKTIGYELRYGNQAPMGDANQPTIGHLLIDGKKHEITWTEANKIVDAIKDLQNVYGKAKRMGIISDARNKIEHGGVLYH